MASGADVVFNTIVPPGLTPFLEQLHDAGFTTRGGHIVCTYFDENFLNLVPAEHVEGLYGCLDYYRAVRTPSARRSSIGTTSAIPGARCSPRAAHVRACTGPEAVGGRGQRGRLVEPGRRRRTHWTMPASPEGPGGPAEMVPGQHHVRMNMYIAQSKGGTFEVVKNLGVIDPKECEVQR